MPSTFSGIEIGKRSLDAHTQGLHTVGHNISNADTKGYSRQRIELSASPPLYVPGLNREERPGQIGQGTQLERIERIKDMMLESRIVSETSGQGYWSSRDKYILMLEQVYNEPSDISVRTLMDRFWEGWQELSMHPSEAGARQAVIQRGSTLLEAVHERFYSLSRIRDMLEDDIVGTVKEVNDLIQGIASLNDQILKVQAMDDNPNDLQDRRDLLINQLSSHVDITISERDPNEFVVYSGGIHIVQGKHFELLETRADATNEGYSRVIWKDTNVDARFRDGKLASLLELRDLDTRDEIQKLDLLTVNFIDLVNEIHRDGYGLTKEPNLDFFVEYPFVGNMLGNYDRNGDGSFDSTYVFRVTGSEVLDPKEQIGLAGTLVLPGSLDDIQVDYFATDTVEDLIERINHSGAEVVARLNREGKLSLKGVPAADSNNPDFVIRHLEDSGQFLVGYSGVLREPGTDGTFEWEAADQVEKLNPDGSAFSVAPLTHPSGWIEINQALITDPRRISTSFDAQAGPGDGSAALAISRLRTQPVMIAGATSFDDFFALVTTEIGLKGEQAEIALETENVILKELSDFKASISGVNIDEELANMLKYQHAYSSAARFISEIDKMLDVIINRMGV